MIKLLLANGQIVDEGCREIYTKRDSLKQEYKKIEANLKWTKKLSGNEFVDTWLNDPQVIKARALLRDIWQTGEDEGSQIVKEIPECLYCHAENSPENELYWQREIIETPGKSTSYFSSYVTCKKCLDELLLTSTYRPYHLRYEYTKYVSRENPYQYTFEDWNKE